MTDMTDHQPRMHEDYDYLRDAFTYHPPKSREQIEKYERLRSAGFEFADLIRTLLPQCREGDLAIDSVRTAVMWANAGLALHGPDTEDVPDEVIHFFGKMTPEDARALKAQWHDSKAYDDRVSQSDHDVTFGPQSPEETTLVDHGDDHPGMTCEEFDLHNENAQLIEGVQLSEEERIGTLQFVQREEGMRCNADDGEVAVVEHNGYNEAVCLMCGRTCPVSNAEAETPDNEPKGCPECGVSEPHTHIDDQTFLDDGREIRVLTGLKPLLEHHGITETPYVLVEDAPLVDEVSHPEFSVQPDYGHVALSSVSKMVSDFLDRNPNALFEPVTKLGGMVKKTFTPKTEEPQTTAERLAQVPAHSHHTVHNECPPNCAYAQWERNR